MTNVTIPRAYRGLLRELSRSSTTSPSSRNKVITANIRRALLGSASGAQAHSQIIRNVECATVFLQAQRTHKELLERYSPLHDLTEEERIKATARRVGLDTPEAYKR